MHPAVAVKIEHILLVAVKYILDSKFRKLDVKAELLNGTSILV